MHVREVSNEVQVMRGGKTRETGLLQCSGALQPLLHGFCHSSDMPFCKLLMQKIGTDFVKGWEEVEGREVNCNECFAVNSYLKKI